MIRIAVQNNGRLMGPSLEFLRGIGLDFQKNSRDLVVKCKNSDVEILFVRNGDIPVYVEQSVADFGILGRNVLIEKNSDLKEVEKLDFGKCSLVLAVPEDSGFNSLEDLEGERIATSYPNTVKSFLKKRGINASIIEIRGSVEASPSLNLSDAVCDITQTGKSLKESNLRVIEKIFDSEAVVVKCPFYSKIKWMEFKKLLKK